jgi:hypothetical protein
MGENTRARQNPLVLRGRGRNGKPDLNKGRKSQKVEAKAETLW